MTRKNLQVPGACLAAGLWVFLAWRMAGMPDPGGLGRLLPLSWLISGILGYRCSDTRPLIPSMTVFTLFALFWRVLPWGGFGAAASSLAGVLAMGLAASKQPLGLVRALVPVALVALMTVPFTSDEVRFAEIAGSITGTRGSGIVARPGDPGPGDSHHTPVYPLLLAPGLPLGRTGIRIMGFLPVLLGALLLRRLLVKHGLPHPPWTAAAAVLLMPGFTLLGPAFTGWAAVAALCGFALLPGKGSGTAAGLLMAFFLIAMKMRFIGAAAGILLVLFLERTRSTRGRILLLSALVVFPVLLLTVDLLLLRGGLFWNRYGTRETLMLIQVHLLHRPGMLLRGFLHMFLDVEAGLLPKAPWALAALTGIPLLYRQDRALFLRLFLPAVSYLLVHLLWMGSYWHGLPAPATRIFLPLVPLLAASLSLVLQRRTTRLLVALSLAISAGFLAAPWARFNTASGNDILMSLLGVSGTAVSMVRPSDPVLLAWTLLVIFLLISSRRDGLTGLRLLLLAGAVFLALPARRERVEAEDAFPPLVHGALLYPQGADPQERAFWFFSTQRMLVLNRPEQHLYIQHGRGLTLRASGEPGALLVVGEDTLAMETPLLPIPEAYRRMGRREAMPDRPENRGFRIHTLTIKPPLHVRIPTGSPPVYLDWLEVME